MKVKTLFQLVIVISAYHAISAQTLATQFGDIQGELNGSIYQFLGIPFAKPPVGALRWKAPENPAVWAATINTIDFAPVCPQKSFDQGSDTGTVMGNEDCLYLNVWTPGIGPGDRPVLVFIHGGGNQQGGASEENAGTQMYFGKNMSDRGDAVIVTIQYRLGPLGYLVHPGLEPENSGNVSGNYAVLDQILALSWVQNNIGNFGGDPAKVMIFGESAGGVNVGNLLTTPLAAGLFQRACIESAVPVINSYEDSQDKGIQYVDSFITTGTATDKISYMRTLSSDALVENETSPVSGGAVGMNWQPVVDNVVFNDFPEQVFQSGNFNNVPLIIGSNSEEMSISVPPTVYPAMVTALINTAVPSGLQAQANLLYPPGSTTTEARASYIGILTDAQFTATTRRIAQCISLNQEEPVWRYFFTYKHSIPALAAFGSYHGMELFYVFNNWENATLGSGALFSASDAFVQDAMLDYWINFATTGDPNGSGLTDWPQYQAGNDCYLEIDATPDGDQCGLRTAQSDLWDAAIGYVSCTSSLGVAETTISNAFIFPNPGQTLLNIEIQEGRPVQSILIYNLVGQLVKDVAGAKAIDPIDVSGLQAGNYIIRIISGEGISNHKFVKE